MTVSIIVFLILGLVLLVGGAEFLVRGASRLALAFGLSPLVVGLTVVAFGTSAPEFAVSVASAYAGDGDLAMGNVVGSNIFNVLVILGLSALIIPLAVNQKLIRFDVPVMIGVSVLLWIMSLDGVVTRLDGIILAAGVIAYTVFLIYQSRKENSAAVKAEYEQEFGAPNEVSAWWKNALLLVIGLGALVLGSKWLVDSAVAIARYWEVSELVIGLTIVAMGTSLPEVATSIVAAVRGERDIAVGNVVGSNIFNILCVIGFSSIVAPSGIVVSKAALTFDIPVMIGVAVACLPVFLNKHEISRANGVAFLLYYGAYLVYLLLMSTQHDLLKTYHDALLWFVLPMTVLTLLFLSWTGWKGQRQAHP